jgi:CDP-4-dehydro-6-deoxyglucose reductase
MIELTVDGRTLECAPEETVLDCLDRNGERVPSSCRAGLCQSCLVRATDGAPPAEAQKGLKPALAAQGYFLACRCKPGGPLAITLESELTKRRPAVIAGITALTPRVLRVRIVPEEPIEYMPGQFLNLETPAGDIRSYSIASLPTEPWLELHVALIPGGKVSGWLRDSAHVGEGVNILGPQGSCCYTPGEPDQPLLLAGTGTGLAPLYGIAREALRHGHTGPIALYHGSLASSGLYLHAALTDLAGRHDTLAYHASALTLEPGDETIPSTPLDEMIFAHTPDLKGWRVFLCGAPEFVQMMQRKVFMAGVSMGAIHADAFVAPAPPAETTIPN